MKHEDLFVLAVNTVNSYFSNSNVKPFRATTSTYIKRVQDTYEALGKLEKELKSKGVTLWDVLD